MRRLFTPRGVRLREHSAQPGDLNWLLLPGGPGIGSESLEGLATALDVPGSVWLVDLPGDGSNRTLPADSTDVFCSWPQVVVEAAQALPQPVFVGHSTGGMYLLATPALQPLLRGLALLDSAPDAGWYGRFVEMARTNPLPAVESATAAYGLHRCDENLAAIAIASAPWNFTPAGVCAGRELLARMPYNGAAVAWSDANFDHTYAARWWPTDIPVLRLAGAEDRIVWQGGWHQERFRTPNVLDFVVPAAGHFPWVENPTAVRDAFAQYAREILSAGRQVR